MNIKLGFILSFIAGLSTLIGSVFIFFNNKKKDNIIISSLAFASGVMSFVSFFDLIPEAFNILNKSYNNIFSLINILLFIIIGIVLSILIDKLLPDKTYNKKDKLYHVGDRVAVEIKDKKTVRDQIVFDLVEKEKILVKR